VAARAYNDAGMELHRRARYADAAALFAKAAAADVTAPLPSYNLACALARLDDPGAETALRSALARDPEQVKRKAAADRDFARVRTRPWFVALVGSTSSPTTSAPKRRPCGASYCNAQGECWAPSPPNCN
jgi:hypothetical protein